MAKTSQAIRAKTTKDRRAFKERLRIMNQWPGVVTVGRLLGRSVREVNALVDSGKLKPVQMPTGERRFDPSKVEAVRIKLVAQDKPPKPTTPVAILLEAVTEASAQQRAAIEAAGKLDHILGEIFCGIVAIEKHLRKNVGPHDARAMLYLLDSQGERCALVQLEPNRQHFHVFWTRTSGRHTLRVENYGNVPIVIYSIEVDQKLQLDQPSAQSVFEIERDVKSEHKRHAVNIRVQALGRVST